MTASKKNEQNKTKEDLFTGFWILLMRVIFYFGISEMKIRGYL